MSESSAKSSSSTPKGQGQPKPRPQALSSAQRRFVRARAHHLRPLVSIGKAGITEGVIDATHEALRIHELIKVSLPGDSSTQKDELAKSLSAITGSHVIQQIGHVVVLFRQKKTKTVFVLPKQDSAHANL